MTRSGLALVCWGLAALLVTAALFLQAIERVVTWTVRQGQRHGYVVAQLEHREALAFVDSVRLGALKPVWYGTQLVAWRVDSGATVTRRWPR